MKKTFNKDTLRAFLYLATRDDYAETKDVLDDKFPKYRADSITAGNTFAMVVEKKSSKGDKCSAIRLTIHGIALADEIITNRNNRFYNIAAFVISVISLSLSILTAVLAM